ncbi:MAG TPA: hypothetical protein VIY47_09540 [Ignavibacteriaceae bacterium]
MHATIKNNYAQYKIQMQVKLNVEKLNSALILIVVAICGGSDGDGNDVLVVAVQLLYFVDSPFLRQLGKIHS